RHRFSYPRGIAITPDGTRAYVTNGSADTISVIDTSINAVIGSPIPVGDAPRGIAITPNGTRAYVVNQFDNTISVINMFTNTVIGSP
ncbi:YncE family protein, partial [Bacillus cereus]|uniref:YncE family protein n=1 Tax=Bacillus cereus TaxID=1396 RepID=UPI003C2B7FF1